MNPITSSSFAAQIYNGVQRTNSAVKPVEARAPRQEEEEEGYGVKNEQ